MKCRFLSFSCQVTSQRRRRMFPLAGTNVVGPGKLNRKHDQQQTQINQPHIFQQRSCIAYYNALPPRSHRDSGSFKNAQPYCLYSCHPVDGPNISHPSPPGFAEGMWSLARQLVLLIASKLVQSGMCIYFGCIDRGTGVLRFFHFPGDATEVQNVWKSTTNWSYTCIVNPFGGPTPTHKEYAWHKPHATQNPSSCPLFLARLHRFA